MRASSSSPSDGQSPSEPRSKPSFRRPRDRRDRARARRRRNASRGDQARPRRPRVARRARDRHAPLRHRPAPRDARARAGSLRARARPRPPPHDAEPDARRSHVAAHHEHERGRQGGAAGLGHRAGRHDHRPPRGPRGGLRGRARRACGSRATHQRPALSVPGSGEPPYARSPLRPSLRAGGGGVPERVRPPPKITLIPPLDYASLLQLMRRSTIVLPDSGGIQEGAPRLRIPVLVMRPATERPEAVEAGCARIVGTVPVRIVAEARRLLEDADAYRSMARVANPFGDGHASERIVAVLRAAIRGETVPRSNEFALRLPTSLGEAAPIAAELSA